MKEKKKKISKMQMIGYICVLIAVIIASFLFSHFKQVENTNEETNKQTITTVDGNAALTFIRSNNGMGSIIETCNSHTIVIDTGSGSNTLLNDYLNGKTIDLLIITHWDDSHSGGLNDLMASCNIQAAYIPENGEIVKLQSSGISTSHPSLNERITVDDIVIQFMDVQYDNLVPMFIHGQDSILYQGNQTAAEAESMIQNQGMNRRQISGIILAGNGINDYYCETLLKCKPDFVVANITLIDQTCNKIDEYVRNNDIDFYNFTYTDTVPLHFSSSGSGVEFIGFE